MTTKYYVDSNGNYLGGFDGEAPAGGTEVPNAPEHAGQKRDLINNVWLERVVPYDELRRLHYPPIGDQLDYIYHNGVEMWKTDMILPVKTQYPKP